MPTRAVASGSASLLTRAIAACLAVTSVAPDAGEFSADVVTRDPAGVVVPGSTTRLYVSNGKVRIDSGGSFYLVDLGAGTSIFVHPERHVFMDAKRSTSLTQIFVPVSPDDPCKQWQAAARIAGVQGAAGNWHCEPVGTGTLDSRVSQEFRVVSATSESSRRWIDPQLRFPVRQQSADGVSISLENIRLGAQLPALFAVPANYSKLEPHALIEQIKHSDVWAGDQTD